MQDVQPATPGIGMAGLVMCPLFKGACLKHGCEWFVELKCGEVMTGRCALAWIPILNIELRSAIDNVKQAAKEEAN